MSILSIFIFSVAMLLTPFTPILYKYVIYLCIYIFPFFPRDCVFVLLAAMMNYTFRAELVPPALK